MGTPRLTSALTDHQPVCVSSAPTAACYDSHGAMSPVPDAATWLRNLGGSSRQGSLRGGASTPKPDASSTGRRTTTLPKPTYAMPRVGWWLSHTSQSSGSPSESRMRWRPQRCAMSSVPCLVREPVDDLPAMGELKRDVDLGVGCRRRCPCYGHRCWCQACLAPPRDGEGP
jgi:hypothetical protein